MKKTLILLFLSALSLPALAAQDPCSSCGTASPAGAEAFFSGTTTPPASSPGGVQMMMQERMKGGMGMPGTGAQVPGQSASCGTHAACHDRGAGPGTPCGCMPGGAPGMMQGGMMQGPQMGRRMGPPMGQMLRGMPWEGAEEAGMLASMDVATLAGELSLTDAQVDQLRAIYRPLQKEAVTQAAKMKVAEMELLDLMDADKPDLKAIEGKVRESESVRSQLRIGRVTAWQKAKAVLTVDQRKKLEGAGLTPCGKPCNPAQCGMGQGMGPMPGMAPGQIPGMMPGMMNR
jgi:Spy/CpxP family protein refolding chaperone